MKKIMILAAFAALVAIGCGGGEDKKEGNGSTTGTPSGDSKKDPEVQKGLELVANDDCLGCHQIKDEFTGPAYTAIADRYRNKPEMADTLIQKIIKGGEGNWGTIPMAAHPHINEEQARLMVKYILSLKGE
jgi:cytochrome c